MRRPLGWGLWLRRPGRVGRRQTRREEGGGQLFLAAVLGVGLALLLIHRLNLALRPQLENLAEAKVRNQITRMADQTVSDVLADATVSSGDLISVRTGENGEISMLTTDTARLNRLRTEVMEEMVAQVETLNSHDLGVPIGSVTGIDLLSALGPKLPVRVLTVASTDAAFRNEFTSAGINQTHYRVMLDVTVSARLLLPGGVVETEVTAPVCVAETVVVGQVPDAYLNLNS